jgi:hypothetical protein
MYENTTQFQNPTAGMKLLILYKRTLPLSVHWVSIIMILAFCSQIILQKSFIVDVSGPCVAMYSLPEEHPYFYSCFRW